MTGCLGPPDLGIEFRNEPLRAKFRNRKFPLESFLIPLGLLNFLAVGLIYAWKKKALEWD